MNGSLEITADRLSQHLDLGRAKRFGVPKDIDTPYSELRTLCECVIFMMLALSVLPPPF